MDQSIPTPHTRRKPVPVLAAMLAASLALAGCGTVGLKPLTQGELAARTAADRAAAREGVEPIGGPLSLEEAIARALKYNLDSRVKRMEEVVALGQLDTASWDMLPRLMADAGYTSRNKDLVTRSVDSVTGAPSLAHPFISSERTHHIYDLGLTWNLLDFGLGYLNAKQQADRVLIAAEHRRKAMHALTQDVCTAFWRTASAQKLHAEVQAAIALAESALADARKAEAESLRSPVEALRYQRQLLENLRLLENIDQELATGRIELAFLINAPLDQPFQVREPGDKIDATLLDVPVQRMEELALARNADIREGAYTSRIAVEETKRAMLRLFPNLSFNAGAKHDSDRYLINNTWNDTGLQLSFNLFNLLAAPSQKRLAEAGVKLADQRRIAAQMAVLAQLHLSRLQYQTAYGQFVRADQVWQADAKIAEHMKNRENAEAQSKLDQVSNSTAAILSLLRRYQSLSQVQSAGSKLQATLGLEPAIGSVADQPLAALTQQVETAMRQWKQDLAPVHE